MIVRDGTSEALADVRAERVRQMHTEGWTPDHDDAHDDGQMARAAAAYIIHGDPRTEYKLVPVMQLTGVRSAADPSHIHVGNVSAPKIWPWYGQWWKPKDRRRDLVRAAALIVAEIERLDRAAEAQGKALVRTYKLRRYGRRGLMAEGAEVRASSADEAIAKARALFIEPEHEHDKFEIEAVE